MHVVGIHLAAASAFTEPLCMSGCRDVRDLCVFGLIAIIAVLRCSFGRLSAL